MAFDVEQELIKWKKNNLSLSLNEESTEELGDHLYEAWVFRCDQGQDENLAWQEALTELNYSKDLERELLQVQELQPIDKWALKIGYILLAFCVVLAGIRVVKFLENFNGIEWFVRVFCSSLAIYTSLVVGLLCFYAVVRQCFGDQGEKFSKAFCTYLRKGILFITISLTSAYFSYALILFADGGIKAFLNVLPHVYWLLFCICFSMISYRKDLSFSVYCSGAALCAILSITCWFLRISNGTAAQALFIVIGCLSTLPLLSPCLKFKKQLSH
ncbi:MAG: hypothetical protein MK132_07715 [Lentisphaerales bacterium]|nr:hypothetical protein [Lentisphaerales bacterium]